MEAQIINGLSGLCCPLSDLSTVAQSENYRKKDLEPIFTLICCLLTQSHHLACFTSRTNIGLPVIERLNSFNFPISCNINKQKHNPFTFSIFMRFSFITSYLSVKEAGALTAGYAIWEASRWRLSFAKSEAL